MSLKSFGFVKRTPAEIFFWIFIVHFYGENFLTPNLLAIDGEIVIVTLFRPLIAQLWLRCRYDVENFVEIVNILRQHNNFIILQRKELWFCIDKCDLQEQQIAQWDNLLLHFVELLVNFNKTKIKQFFYATWSILLFKYIFFFSRTINYAAFAPTARYVCALNYTTFEFL